MGWGERTMSPCLRRWEVEELSVSETRREVPGRNSSSISSSWIVKGVQRNKIAKEIFENWYRATLDEIELLEYRIQLWTSQCQAVMFTSFKV